MARCSRSLALIAPAMLLALLVTAPAFAEDAAPKETPPSGQVSYYRDIRPIFQEHCQGCHQPSKSGGEYVMTSFERLVAGGESGEAAIVPGQPDTSYLLEQITPADGEAAMPKESKPLADAQIDLIRRWIEQGATDDSPISTRPQYDSEHPPVYSAPPVLTALDFSPDGSLLAVSGYHEVVLHRGDGAGIVRRLVGLSERIESAVFSPDGKRLAVTGGSPGRMGEVQVWNVETGELLLAKTVGYDTCYGASWSPDGKVVAFGCPDNIIRAVDAETGEQVLFNGAHDDWVLDTVFSIKGDHLVSVSRDMSMKLINVGTQQFIDNITSITPGALKGGLTAVDRHPERDEVITGGADGTPKLYKMYRDMARKIGDDFNLIRAFPAMPGRVFDVAFSADGTQIVAGSSLDGQGEVRVYRVEDAHLLAHVKLPTGIYAVAFHPSGQVVAAGGFDGYVRLLDATTGEVKQQFFPVELEREDVAASP